MNVFRGGNDYTEAYVGIGFNSNFTLTPVAGVPEPASMALLGSGLLGLGLAARLREGA